jgi:hypothetical protein
MEDYLGRFDKMVEGLRAHPEVIVTRYSIRPPAHSLLLRKAESFADAPLPEALKRFYEKCDGLQLRWFHRRSENFDPEADYSSSDEPFDLQFPDEDELQATGCVNILPISAVFSSGGEWEGLIWRHTTSNLAKVEFGSKQYPRLDFLQSVRPLDQFDSYYNMALVFAAKEDSKIPIVMGRNHHSDYGSSKVVEFKTYIEFILKTKGLVAARPRYFSNALSNELEVFAPQELEDVPTLDLNGNDFDE